MRLAYADPPYYGSAVRFYGEQAAEYDTLEGHARLIRRLVEEFPDGWALSMSSTNLWNLLRLCPSDVRVAAWVKPFASFKPGVNPAYAWEPIIVRGGRKRGRAVSTVRDFVSCNITLKRGLAGAKPEAVCRWLFDVLGAAPEDTLVDLFPGTGGVGRAWDAWRAEAVA